MPKFGRNSREHLETCHPDLQTLFNAVVEEIDCTVLCGHRNEEDQEKAVDQGFSKVHFPDGKHNALPSNAIDVLPWPVDWNELSRFYWFSGWVLAKAEILRNVGEISHKIRWGGNWGGFNKGVIDFKKNKFNDLPHYEIIQ